MSSSLHAAPRRATLRSPDRLVGNPVQCDADTGCARVQAGSLRNRRPNGGAGSLVRTRLWVRIPDLQGNYREITASGHPGVGRSAVPGPFLGPMESISLNLETGKFLPTSRESRDANCESCS